MYEEEVDDHAEKEQPLDMRFGRYLEICPSQGEPSMAIRLIDDLKSVKPVLVFICKDTVLVSICKDRWSAPSGPEKLPQASMYSMRGLTVKQLLLCLHQTAIRELGPCDSLPDPEFEDASLLIVYYSG